MISLFKVLGNEKRKMIIKLLKRQDMHISGIARELNISVPAALKHIKKLEDADLVLRTKVGNTHLIKIKEEGMEKLNLIWGLFDEPLVLEITKGTNLSDALKVMPEVGIKKTNKGCFINSVDGKKGYFVYEIDGNLIDKPIDRYKISEDIELEIKRLLPALDKKIRIRVK